MEDYYTIQTAGHHSTMFAELHVLQKQGVMCDVILAAEDGEVMAHKVVLMAASRYFREKLSPVIGPTASKICLKGISVVELANLVKYIYTGKLLVAKETMDITLEISEILELQGVIQGYKEIISYEQLKGTPGNPLLSKSEDSPQIPISSAQTPVSSVQTPVSSVQTPVSSVQSPVALVQTPGSSGIPTSTGKTSISQKTLVQKPKPANQQAFTNTSEPTATTVKKILPDSPSTQSVATKEIALMPSSVLLSDLSKGPKMQVNKQGIDGAATQVDNVASAVDAPDVSTTQPSSNDFNFDSLYDQQYMDVSAGSQTPSKTPGTNTPQSGITPPKMQQMTSVSSESQKIAEERAQHQDLLAVAIETLSDVPHLKQQLHQFHPEVDRAVNSISGTDPSQVVSQPFTRNYIGVKPEDENLEEYENGLTSTKTVTMSAGSVSNDLGGKTDVYTVALDPSSVKSPLKMPRPKRSKTAKEKEAEEKAKKYRQIKAVLMSGTPTDTKPQLITNIEPRRGNRQKNPTFKQDFQYESLSKAKKKTLNPKIVLMSKDSICEDESESEFEVGPNENYLEPNLKIVPQVIKIRKGDAIKLPKEEKIEAEGDNFGQVVNFDSDSEDDVDGMMVAASGEGKDKERSGKPKDRTNMKENKKEENILTSQLTDGKGDNNKSNKLDSKNSNDTDSLKCDGKDKHQVNVPAKTKSPEKQQNTNVTTDDVSEMRELYDDLQSQNVDEDTAERMKSSSTKRKTRTPRKLPLSDEEKGIDSGPDRHENIPVVRTRRSNKSLNLEKEKESKPDHELGDDEPKNSESGKKKKSIVEGGNIDCKGKDLSKAAEITIIAQNKVDEKELGEAEMQISDSKSKKIIIVPKYYQPEVRLKKQTHEEMLKMAKEIPKSQSTVPPDEIEIEMECETGNTELEYGTEEGEDDEKIAADNFIENAMNENTNGGKAVKRKLKKLFKSSPVKKRKTDDLVDSTAELCATGIDKMGNKSTSKSTDEAANDDAKDKEGNSGIISSKENLDFETQEEEMEMKIEVDEEVDVVNETNKVVSRSKSDRRSHMKGKGKRSKKNDSASPVKPIGTEDQDVDKAVNDEEADKERTDLMEYVCVEADCQFSCSNVVDLRTHRQASHSITDGKDQQDVADLPVKNAKNGSTTCGECGKTFKAMKILKKHMEYSHTDKEKIQCEYCDFATPYKSSMSTHRMIAHSKNTNLFMCKFCEYSTPLTGNLRKHLFGSHGLIVVTRQHKKLQVYEEFEEGSIITKNHQLFDPETMEVPKTPRRKSQGHNKDSNKTEEGDKDMTEGKKRTRISLNKLPVEDFLQEMMKRHQDYVKKPEKNYSFMSNSIAAATEHPSFPQASPQVRNTRANKIYNMKKLKPTFVAPPEPISGSYGIGNVHGMYHGMATVPQVASEVEVEHDNHPEVVLENVESDTPTTVLTISEQKGSDGAEMILINQNGKQTIVRSKDFYDTLQATGHDTNETLGVISALLQAGEQIEIREQQEEIVEIQNM